MVKDINQLNRFVKKNNDFIRMFTAGVKLTDLDSSGRLLIPRDLKSFANIETEIVLSSSGNMIEIWNKSNYEKTVNDSESNFSKMAEEVMGNINSDQMNDFHNPVLLKASVKGLKIKKEAFMLTRLMEAEVIQKKFLKSLGEEGKLVAFDQDDEAIDKNIIRDERLIMINNNFRYIKNCLNSIGINEIDGIIADLGISSHQINTSRGFSFNTDQELDMRMNKNAKFSAQEILNQYDKENLSRMLNEHPILKIVIN